MTIGRPLQFDPDQALDTAMRLFWRKGYESTSLQDLLNATGLSKSSFYQAFKSKSRLFQRAIQHYKERLTDDLRAQRRQAGSGRAFIEALFRDVADETSGPDSRRGCLLMNTANEFAQSDADIARLVSNSLDRIVVIFEEAIRQAQSEGTIDQNKDARALAVYLLSNMSGLKSMVKAGADRATIEGIVDITLSALD